MPAMFVSIAHRLGDALVELSRKPIALFGILLLINALCLSYLGMVHDARLYSGQVLNRFEPGLLVDDLFFRYGSQDRFSLFSPVMAPLVSILGMRAAFFAAYLACVMLFLGAMTRIVPRLWPDSPGAVAGLIFLSMTTIPYGGFNVFHVLEPFLTARLPACALSLWALADWLDRRPVRAGVFALAALSMHPLMTLPVALVVVAVAIARTWGNAWLIAGIAIFCLTITGILATPALATRLFGSFDAEWLRITQDFSWYQFPQLWSGRDWFWNLFCLSGVLLSGWLARRDSSDRALVLGAMVALGLAGIVGSFVFSRWPYALLVQGQAYRWLWLPLAMAPMAVFDLAGRGWRTERFAGRFAAIAVVVALNVTTLHWLEFACLAGLFPILLYGFTIFDRMASGLEKVTWAALISVVVGFAIFSVYRLVLVLTLVDDSQQLQSLSNRIELVLAILGRSVVFPLLLLLIAGVGSSLTVGVRGFALILAAVLIQLGTWIGIQSEWSQPCSPYFDERQFAQRFLEEKRNELGRTPTVYCNAGRLDWPWLDWRVQSYYCHGQVAGLVFHRATAIEAERRVRLAGPLECAFLLRGLWDSIPPARKDRFVNLYGPDSFRRPPSERDLLCLANDPKVDYIILVGDTFEHLAPVRHGEFSIFDCHALRQRPPMPDADE